MSQVFIDNPWLVLCVVIAVVSVTCTALVFITDYLRKSHQAEIDAALKQDMLNRGLSAADIKTILEASSDGEEMRMAMCGDQGVRVGLGKFQVEVGAVNKSVSPTAESAAARG
jgi:tartrate dehydratase alpha subunit/fumarate hydratase class I-like protein